MYWDFLLSFLKSLERSKERERESTNLNVVNGRTF